MKYFVLDTYEDLSRRAAGIVMDQLTHNPQMLLGAATGNSPSGLYAYLAGVAQKTPEAFSALRVIKLDEWLGLPMDDPGTCETYLRSWLVQPLHLSDDRFLTFHSNPADPGAECRAIMGMLDRHGPMDVCVLGLGLNGHIAFNEPAAFLTPHAHVAPLAKSSQSHSMVAGSGIRPVSGLTLGMADIMASRLILLLISGASKRNIVQRLMSQEITTDIPASLLWLHPNAVCLMDRASYQ